MFKDMTHASSPQVLVALSTLNCELAGSDAFNHQSYQQSGIIQATHSPYQVKEGDSPPTYQVEVRGSYKKEERKSNKNEVIRASGFTDLISEDQSIEK